MLKSSRTWPSILTMAVVQLKFDQKGKYSYSTIANNNLPTKFNENENVNVDEDDKLCDQSDLTSPKSCRRKIRSLSMSTNFSSSTSPAHNSATVVNCPTTVKNSTKICLCELEFRENQSRTKRSHSINVENWQLIYRENPASNNGSKELIGNGHGNYPK